MPPSMDCTHTNSHAMCMYKQHEQSIVTMAFSHRKQSPSITHVLPHKLKLLKLKYYATVTLKIMTVIIEKNVKLQNDSHYHKNNHTVYHIYTLLHLHIVHMYKCCILHVRKNLCSNEAWCCQCHWVSDQDGCLLVIMVIVTSCGVTGNHGNSGYGIIRAPDPWPPHPGSVLDNSLMT